MKKKKKSTPYPLLIIIASLFMSIGYATVNSIVLELKGDATAKIPEDLQIIDIEISESKNATGIINLYDKTFFDSTIELSNDETKETYLTLKITLYNGSDNTYKFNNINYEIGEDTYDNSNIIFTHTIEENKQIISKETYEFYITYKYSNQQNIISNILNNKLNIEFVKETTSMKLSELILLNESEPTDGNAGLYTYEETKKYYSGDNVNNYIWYNCISGHNSGEEYCETWRIISIEEDGSIKIVRNNVVSQEKIASLEEETQFWKTNINDDSKTNTMIKDGKVMFDPRYRRPVNTELENSYCIRNNNGCNAYSKTTKIGTYKDMNLDEDSAIKLYLENIWLEKAVSPDAKKKLQYGDYNIGLVDTNKNITTVISSEKNIIHTSKIGLLNISDYMLASTEETCKKSFTQYNCGTSNWMNNIEEQIVLMNGRINNTNAQIWSIKTDGTVYSQDSNYGMHLRPVVTLDKDIKASGKGTSSDYYVLQ